MFFKDIDSWTKSKLRLVTCIVACLYAVASCIVPCIIIGCQYGLFYNGSNYRLTGAGLIVIVIIVSFGGKAIKSLFHFLPRDTQKQQIVRYTIECIAGLIVPALCLWGVYLVQKNVELACTTATQCIISIMVAVIINNLAFKSLIYQWQCVSEVSHRKKIARIENAQARA